MPQAFDNCVSGGGRVRTKDVGDGKYMHICFLNGKSVAGEVKTKKEGLEFDDMENEYIKKDGKWEKIGPIKNDESKNLNLQTTMSILEGTINEDKMTVEACVLTPCLSLNNRYYSPHIVETAVSQLIGLKSFADHNDRSIRNTIAKIVNARLEDGRAIATFKFSKARDIAESVFTRIKEGLITDVSIAASGATKRVKMNGDWVDEVQDIHLHSVDFVSEGGVPEAKVMRVFESNALPTIEEGQEELPKEINTKEVTKMTIDELRTQYPELVIELEKPISELKTQVETLTKTIDEAKAKEQEKKLADYKGTLMATIVESDTIKSLIEKKIIGTTEEELKKSFDSAVAEVNVIKEATTKIVGIPAIDVTKNGKKKQFKSSQEILNDDELSMGEKSLLIHKLWFG